MKLTKILPLLVSSLLLCLGSFLPHDLGAQTTGCGTDDVQLELLKRNPVFQQKQKEAESKTYKSLKHQYESLQKAAKSSACGDDNEKVYRIPLVVHIMHLPEDSIPGTGSNPSDQQIQTGIDHLNQAFRNEGSYAGGPYHTNATSYGVQSEDAKIQFILARRDPSGNSTNGINRISTSYSNVAYAEAGPAGFSTQDAYMKSLSYWDSEDYTNVWLVNEICKYEPDSICGVAGYAYLAGAHGYSYDGIVNEARYWGTSTSASKVHIHEVGHYLNLYHTFNDPDGSASKTPCENGDCLRDGDFVCDTPPDNSSSAVSCNSSGTANSCSTDADDTSEHNPFTTDVDDMYENYMDYGYQSCQNTFTQGQKDRMRLALTAIRSSLLTSDGLKPVNVADAEIAHITRPSSTLGCESFTSKITLKNQGDIALTSAEIAVALDGVFKHAVNWSGNLSSGASEEVSFNSISTTPGTHNLTMYLQKINGSSTDGDSFNDTASLCFEVYAPSNNFPYCQDFEFGSSAPGNWSESNSTGSDLWSRYSSGTGCSAEQGGSSYYLNNWYATFGFSGEDIDLMVSSLDLSGLSQVELTFAHAYIRSYSSRKLELEVAVSTDCGNNFQTIETWNDDELATNQNYEYVNSWAPASCDDWHKDTLDLAAFSGQTILIRFRAKVQAYYSQNLYLDNVCIKGVSTSACAGLGLNTSKTDATCQQANGSATVQATSGTSPYTYSWNTQPAQTTASLTNLSEGTYQVIVTDSAGCKDTAQVIVEGTGTLASADFDFSSTGLATTFSNNSTEANSYIWDFGDGNTSTTENPSHSYGSAGTYTVCLFSTNTCGTDTLCQAVVVGCASPTATFSYDHANLTSTFVNSSTEADSYFWDFGEGNTSSDENPTHSFAQAGTYTVCLTATNVCGTDSSCQQVTVTCKEPKANFGFGINNLVVDFVNNSADSDSYSWNFGDGASSADVNPSHTYAEAGTYAVCLISSNSCGADTSCMQVTVDCPLPTSSFRYDKDELSVTYVNGSQTADSYSWDFGDGNTSSDINPVHNYSAKGTYTVCLFSTNSCGVTSSCQEITLSCTDPIANFSYDANQLAIGFTDSSSSASTYYWDFGDGNVSSNQHPTHTYEEAGEYMVCLIVENVCSKDTICNTVTIECPLPVAGFNPDASGLNMIFLNTSVNATRYSWDFGDGFTSKLPRPFHTFDLPGTYRVCQTVYNDCGQDSVCQEVVVSCPGPVSKFDYTKEDLRVEFSSTSSTGASYAWDFGDGHTSKSYEPTHTYDTSGVYAVSLVVSTVCGADTASTEIVLTKTTAIAPESLISAQVYPNPSTGVFYLEIDEILGEEVILVVTDIKGKLILEKSLPTYGSKLKKRINLAGQPEGVYFLSLWSDSKQFVQKISLKY